MARWPVCGREGTCKGEKEQMKGGQAGKGLSPTEKNEKVVTYRHVHPTGTKQNF